MAKFNSNYRRDIDGLRAIAVLAVVFFHTFPAWCRGGFVGVDVFFVISGYLITSIIVNEIKGKTFSFANFYRRRAQRIFPALILVLGSSLLWGWVTLLPNDFKALARQAGAGAAFASNLLMYNETGYFEQATELKPLMHLWSLGVEEQFYLVWPVFLMGLALLPRMRKRMMTCVGLIVVCSFLLNLWQVSLDQNAAFYLPFSRFWELLAGAVLVFIQERSIAWKWGSLWAALGLMLVCLSVSLIHADTSFPGWRAAFPVLGAVLLIGSGPDTPVHRVILGNRLLVWVGLISYPLYLWHWVILSFIRIEADYPAWYLRLSGVVASVVLAWLTYSLFEKRLRHSQRAIVLWSLLAALGGICVVSIGVLKFDWFVREASVLELQLTQPYNTEEAYRYKRCFLDPLTQGAQDFAAECGGGLPSVTDGGAKQPRQILLWGDSLSAQLYSGLQNLVDSKRLPLFVAQRTAGSCPPGLEEDKTEHGSCDDINEATREYIRHQRPYAVIINGRWENGRVPEVRIPQLVQYLRAQGVVRIVVVGPTPDWAPDLKKLLLRRHFDNDRLPEKLEPPRGYWSTTIQRNEQLKSLAQLLGVDYLSPIGEFCDAQRCLIRVADSIPEGLIASDHDHMTELASKYFFLQSQARTLFENISR